MSGARRPVYVLAAGAVSPLGFDWRGLWDALAVGDRGREVVAIPAELDTVPDKQRKLMSRAARLSVLATAQALREAPAVEREALAQYMAAGAGDGVLEELEALARATIIDGQLSQELLARRGARVVNPLATFRLMHNLALCHPAIAEGIGGDNGAFLSRGAGTLFALSEAIERVASGEAEHALAGGADSLLDPLARAALARQGLLAADVSPAEGAAVLLLGADRSAALAEVVDCSVAPCDPPALARLSVEPEEAFVFAGAAREARELLRARAYAVPDDARRDLCASIGCAPAATPALAWAAALDALTSGRARSAVASSLCLDGQLGIVRLRSPGGAAERPRKPAGPARRDEREPVISGAGVVSAFGVGLPALLSGLFEGRAAVGEIRSFDTRGSPVVVGGEVPVAAIDAAWMSERLGPNQLVARLEADGVLRDRKSAFAVLAAAEAWRAAGCGDAERGAWLSLAVGLEHTWFEDFAAIFDGERFDWQAERDAPLPPVRLRSPPLLAADCVAEFLALRAPVAVDCSACAGGALAVARAASLVARGAADVVIAGGADSMLNPLAIGGFAGLGAPSRRATPDACRPFDASRDGLVIGEGAAVFVIESAARARARGVRPLARILGWGSSQDAYRPTMPRPDGAAARRAMRGALERARLGPEAIGWINAHGTGTPLNDPAEVRAIRGAFGPAAERCPVSSIKGAIGHAMAASGAIELAASLLAFERGVIAATANHRERDPECDLDIVGRQPRRASVDAVLSNSFGFGGQNASVILGRY